MATKLKAKNKSPKKAVSRHSNGAKSLGLKAKPAAKTAPKTRLKVRPKVEHRRTVVAQPESRSTTPQKVRSTHFSRAVHAYEAGIKLMHAETFDKAIKCLKPSLRITRMNLRSGAGKGPHSVCKRRSTTRERQSCGLPRITTTSALPI
jgi:hypothetical protein